MSQDFENTRWSSTDQSLCFRHIAALEYIQPTKSVLDVGCGDGLFLSLAKEKGAVCYGIDQSEAGIEKTKKRLGEGANLTTSNAVYDLPFSDGSFDVVTALDVLEHVLEPDKLLKELARISKDSVVVSVPNFSSLPARLQCLIGRVPENNRPNKGHVYWFNNKELTRIVSICGLEVVNLKMNIFKEKYLKLVKSTMLNVFPNLFALSYVVLLKKKN